MDSSIAATTICTVHALKHDEFLYDPHNAQFSVCDEERHYETDSDASRARAFSPSVHSEADDTIPIQHRPEAFLRITADHTPRDPTVGFVFGRDPKVCDVVLAWGQRQISSQHFAVGPGEAGNLAIKNRCAKHTLIASQALGTMKLQSEKAIPHGGAEADIQPPDCDRMIKIRFTGLAQLGFAENWDKFVERCDLPAPDLSHLKLQSTTTSSNYYRGQRLGSVGFWD